MGDHDKTSWYTWILLLFRTRHQAERADTISRLEHTRVAAGLELDKVIKELANSRAVRKTPNGN